MGGGGHDHFLAAFPPPPRPKSHGRSSRIWIIESLVFAPGFQLRTVQPITSDYRLRPPGPAHMSAYSMTLDPHFVRVRRYWSLYWDWKSLELALVAHKICTVMVCSSLRLKLSGGSELSVWPGIRYTGQVSWFHKSGVHSGKHSRSCHVCPYHNHHIFRAYNLCNRNFSLII
jgi:hypothetical protein